MSDPRDLEFGPWDTRPMGADRRTAARLLLVEQVKTTAPTKAATKPATAPRRSRMIVWTSAGLAAACAVVGVAMFVTSRAPSNTLEDLAAQVKAAVDATWASGSFTTQTVYGAGDGLDGRCSYATVDSDQGIAVIEQRGTTVSNDQAACGGLAATASTYFTDGYFGATVAGQREFATASSEVLADQLRRDLLLDAVTELVSNATDGVENADGSRTFHLAERLASDTVCEIPRVRAAFAAARWADGRGLSDDEIGGQVASCEESLKGASMLTVTLSGGDSGTLVRAKLSGTDVRPVSLSISGVGSTTVAVPEEASAEREQALANGTACELTAPWMFACPVEVDPTIEPSQAESTTVPVDQADPVAAVSAAIEKTLQSSSFKMTTYSLPGAYDGQVSCAAMSVYGDDKTLITAYGVASYDASLPLSGQELSCGPNTIFAPSGTMDGGRYVTDTEIFDWDPGREELGRQSVCPFQPVDFETLERWQTDIARLQRRLQDVQESRPVVGRPGVYELDFVLKSTPPERCGLATDIACILTIQHDVAYVALTDDGRLASVSFGFKDRAAAEAIAVRQLQLYDQPVDDWSHYLDEQEWVFDSYGTLGKPLLPTSDQLRPPLNPADGSDVVCSTPKAMTLVEMCSAIYDAGTTGCTAEMEYIGLK